MFDYKPNFTVAFRHPIDRVWKHLGGYHNKVTADAVVIEELKWDRNNLTTVYDYRVIDNNTGDIFTTLGTGA